MARLIFLSIFVLPTLFLFWFAYPSFNLYRHEFRRTLLCKELPNHPKCRQYLYHKFGKKR